jgi:hypothetical protein
LLPECERVLQEVALAPQRKEFCQRIAALQQQYNAALSTEDFECVASLGLQLQALQQQSAQLPLSEEDYLALPTRHAELVRRVTDQCHELTRLKDYVALGPLAARLTKLKAAASLAGILGKRGREEEEGGSA